MRSWNEVCEYVSQLGGYSDSYIPCHGAIGLKMLHIFYYSSYILKLALMVARVTPFFIVDYDSLNTIVRLNHGYNHAQKYR